MTKLPTGSGVYIWQAFSIFNGDVDQLLRISLKTAIQPVAQADALLMAKRGELKRREHTIAAEAVRGRKDVTGLLTSQGCTAGEHCGMNVLIADRGAFESSTSLLPGALKSQVGHHCGNQALIR